MTFGDPLDITMSAQRKFLNSMIPCVKRHTFKEKWLKHVQLSARVWTGFIIDYLTMVILAIIYGWTLPNWTIGWKMISGVCVVLDVVLLLALGLPIACRLNICPRSLRRIDERAERTCRCDIFAFEFAAFKSLSFLHGLFIVGQGLVNAPDSLSYHYNNARLCISVVAIIDVVLNSIEMFASGCFWCVCCIHSTEVSPEAEAMSDAESKFTGPRGSTATEAYEETVFATESSSQVSGGAAATKNNPHSDEVQSVYISNRHPLSDD